MDNNREYFLCDNCANKDFNLIYNFSLHLHKVNFSDDLIYDEIVEEMYQCTNCKKTFTKKHLRAGLDEFRKNRK